MYTQIGKSVQSLAEELNKVDVAVGFVILPDMIL